LRSLGDDGEFVELEPTGAAYHFLGINAVGGSNEIHHRRVVQFVAALAEETAGHAHAGIAASGMHISDVERGCGRSRLTKHRRSDQSHTNQRAEDSPHSDLLDISTNDITLWHTMM
jgi:hypothetical protein